MKTGKLLISAFIFASCLASCDNKNEVEIPEELKEELQLSTEVGTAELTGVETKADPTGFYDKKFTLVVQDNRSSNKFALVSTNAETTTTTNGENKAKVTLSPDPLYWDDLGGKLGDLNLAGVYPRGVSLTSGELEWSAKSDQSGGIEGSDLMLAHVASYKYQDKSIITPANLIFYHALTKITLNLGGNFYSPAQLNTAQVTINNVYLGEKVSLTPTSGSYTYTKEASATSVTPMKEEIKPNETVTGYSFTAIVYPFSAAGESQIATIVIEGNTYNVKLPATPESKSFNAGANNVFNVLINKTEVSVTASVVEWNDEDNTDITSKLLFNVKDIKITDNETTPSEDIITNGSLLHLWIKSDGKDAERTTYIATVSDGSVSWRLYEENEHIYWDDLAKDATDGYQVNSIKAMLVLGGATTNGDAIYMSQNQTLGKNIIDQFDLGDFTHPLAKVTIEVETSTGDDAIDLDDIQTVKFPSGWKVFNIQNNASGLGIVETGADLTGIDQDIEDKAVYVAFVCPTKSDVSTLCTVNVDVDGTNSNDYNVTLSPAQSLTAGKHYKYTVVITKTNISFTGQVVDWDDIVEVDEIETQL